MYLRWRINETGNEAKREWILRRGFMNENETQEEVLWTRMKHKNRFGKREWKTKSDFLNENETQKEVYEREWNTRRSFMKTFK